MFRTECALFCVRRFKRSIDDMISTNFLVETCEYELQSVTNELKQSVEMLRERVLIRIVSEMSFNMSSGTLNPTIPYRTVLIRKGQLTVRAEFVALQVTLFPVCVQLVFVRVCVHFCVFCLHVVLDLIMIIILNVVKISACLQVKCIKGGSKAGGKSAAVHECSTCERRTHSVSLGCSKLIIRPTAPSHLIQRQ